LAQPDNLRLTPRRDFLVGALGCLPAWAGASAVADIVSRIRPPRFPDRSFDVERFGARGDNRTDCRAPFQEAIAACHRAGGGRVTVPPGNWLSNGPIHLAGNVNLHLAAGAKILFGVNPADYLPAVLTRWEGTRCHNYSPLIYAYRQENIAITGQGSIDGRTREFWHEWKKKQSPDQNALREMGARREPVERRVFGDGHYLRPSLFQPYDCRNVLVEGVTFQGSPFWTVHPVFCENVTVRGIHVLPGTTNDDGVDPDSCRDVLIENCVFETADDNIAIKAGRDQDAWGDRPCENIVIRGCTGVRSKANGYCIGSEMSGDVRNVFIEDNQVGDVEAALYIKSNSDRGGAVENVWMRRNTVESCDCFIKLETDYKGVTDRPYPSQYRNFHFEDLTCRTARKCAIYSVGIAARPIEGVHFRNVTIGQAGMAKKIQATSDVEMVNVSVNGELL
jgi:polygalacturonase